MHSQLLEGLTDGINLNPDILCNQHIKFKALFHHLTPFNVDRVATGHYARLRHLEDGERGSCGHVMQSCDQTTPRKCQDVASSRLLKGSVLLPVSGSPSEPDTQYMHVRTLTQYM